MKKQDHKALAHYLLNHLGQGRLFEKKWHRRLFLLGSVSPDYLPFTYLRGFWRSRAMLGHNTKYSMAHIQRSIKRLQKRGVETRRDCFALGTLMHYLADSFTFPHTESFEGNMSAHRRYEKELHACFAHRLSLTLPNATECRPIGSLTSFLRDRREAYEEISEKNCQHDAGEIICACSGIFSALCEGTR